MMKQTKTQSSLELMKTFPTKKWWSPVLIACVLFFVLQLSLGSLIGIVLTPLVGAESGELLATLYSFIGILAGTILVNRYYNKRPDTTLGFHRKNWLKQYALGVLFGLAMLAVVVGGAMALGVIKLEINPSVKCGIFLAILVGFMIQGMTEEVLMRGYLQNSLATTKSFWFAMIGQAVVFTAIHGANPGITPMALLNLFVVAILFGMLFCYTDSMWLVGGMHFAWNFVLGPVLGIEVSGNALPTTFFQAKVAGAELLTGGNFGIEASILTTLVAVIGSAVLYRKLKR